MGARIGEGEIARPSMVSQLLASARPFGAPFKSGARYQGASGPGRLAVASSKQQSSSGGGSGGRASSSSAEDPNPGLGLKAVWVGAEAFGNVIGATKGSQQQQQQQPGIIAKALSRQEALALIREDYDERYFISGEYNHPLVVLIWG